MKNWVQVIFASLLTNSWIFLLLVMAQSEEIFFCFSANFHRLAFVFAFRWFPNGNDFLLETDDSHLNLPERAVG